MTFYLGTHIINFLGRTDVPLFVSARRLRTLKVKKPPKALGSWALDSGGFSELSLYGRWVTTPQQYADEARRWRDQVGGLSWAAAQDWMCEPLLREGGWVVRKTQRRSVPGTKLSVAQHQRLTTANYLELLRLAPDVSWVPVLQGWKVGEYLEHVRQYREAGIDLASLPLVGVGSVCRRQNTTMAEELIRVLAARGLKLHAFGFKTLGLPRVARYLKSSDSMAWSFRGRNGGRSPDCTHPGKCAHCLPFALWWRGRVLAKVERHLQRPHHPAHLYDLFD